MSSEEKRVVFYIGDSPPLKLPTTARETSTTPSTLQLEQANTFQQNPIPAQTTKTVAKRDGIDACLAILQFIISF
jgi:hypothetical protein